MKNNRVMKRSAVVCGVVAMLSVVAYAASDEEKTGGDTTVFADGRNAFSFPAANLPEDERTRFAIGNSFFRRNWVQAPASTTARDGLGPHFIARSCGGCHVQDGRGQPPKIVKGFNATQPVELLLRLSIAGQPEKNQGVVPDPVYGDQFNNAAIDGVKPEGQVVIRYETVRGKYPDGTPYALKKPTYSLKNLAYGPTHPDLMISPRIAPQLIGVGLLEAIAEQDILENAKTQLAQQGPIRGVPNRVWDQYGNTEMIGRFGWKANVGSLAHQTAGAFLGDIGISSHVFPKQTCTDKQVDCLKAPVGAKAGDVELDDATFKDVVFYQAVLAPPARRAVDSGNVLLGKQRFIEAQCAVCHRPSYTTSKAPFPELSSKVVEGQTIFPYTDLLLHDMGEGLADHRPDFKANGLQWKTPPLWGVGLIADVNGHQQLLHDGRAKGVEEAILWHGGEAEHSKRLFMNYSAKDRAALIAFVNSL